MDMDKENYKRLPPTKIHLASGLNPSSPRNLLNKKDVPTKVKHTRLPLRTLNSQLGNVNLPSTSKNVLKPVRSKIFVDTRHVTIRKKNDDQRVHEDEDSTISLSDDDEVNEVVQNVEKKNKNKLTPIPKKQIELNQFKNVKKSLKRPSSRELQGIADKKSKVDEKLLSRNKRVIHDGLIERLQSPDYLKRIYTTCVTRDYCADIFMNLIASECKALAVPKIPCNTRACLINWLTKVNGPDGNPAVLQTAIWYFDSILGTLKVHLSRLQLVTACCYWIAQKLHGPYLPAERLVAYSNNAFTVDLLVGTEKLILCRLKFPPQPVLPQEFITYFSWWCDCSRPGEIEVAATFICMSGLMVDKALCNELPSAIAAAAVINALVLLKKRSLVHHLQMNKVYMQIEKKAENLNRISAIFRKAVCTITSPIYEHKMPFKHYDIPPLHIAQRVADTARELVLIDAKQIEQLPIQN